MITWPSSPPVTTVQPSLDTSIQRMAPGKIEQRKRSEKQNKVRVSVKAEAQSTFQTGVEARKTDIRANQAGDEGRGGGGGESRAEGE